RRLPAAVFPYTTLFRSPSTGTVHGVDRFGYDSRRRGWALARYQLSDAVSAPGSDRVSIQRTVSGWSPTNLRNIAQSCLDRTSSALPSNWKSNMYHEAFSWRSPPLAKAAGCPIDSATRVRTRSGWLRAMTHAAAAPQS